MVKVRWCVKCEKKKAAAAVAITGNSVSSTEDTSQAQPLAAQNILYSREQVDPRNVYSSKKKSTLEGNNGIKEYSDVILVL